MAGRQLGNPFAQSGPEEIWARGGRVLPEGPSLFRELTRLSMLSELDADAGGTRHNSGMLRNSPSVRRKPVRE